MQVTNEERELVFEIAQGNPNLIRFIGHMRVISQDAKQVGYMDILRYMKRQHLKGDSLVEWITEKHQGSLLNAIATLRQKAYSDFKVRKIFAKRII